jgi:hypothetical protein
MHSPSPTPSPPSTLAPPVPQFSWAVQSVSASSGDGSTLTCLAALPDGSLVAGGYFFTRVTLGSVILNGGTQNAFLARYDSSGNVLWAKAVVGGGSGNDNDNGLNQIAVVGSDVVAVGFLSGQATFGPGEANQTVVSSIGPLDFFIAHFDGTDGTLVSVKHVGGPGAQVWANDGVAACTTDGSVVATTTVYTGSAVFGSGEPNQTTVSTAQSDAVFARFNSDLTLAWARQTSSSSGSAASAISVTALPDGSSVAVGAFGGTVTFGSGEAGQTTLTATVGPTANFYVTCLGPDGNLSWVRQLAGADPTGNGTCTVPDGSIVVSGLFQGPATFDPGGSDQVTLSPDTAFDAFLARFDSSGTLLSAVDMGPGHALGVTTLSNGTLLCAGDTQEEPHGLFLADVTPGGSPIDYDAYLSDPSGQVYTVGVVALPDGSAVLGGQFSQASFTLPGLSTPLSPANQSEFFLARFR